MLAHYPACETTLIEGSDHAISDFAELCRRRARVLRRMTPRRDA